MFCLENIYSFILLTNIKCLICIFHTLFHLLPPTPAMRLGVFISLILETGKLRLREIKQLLAQDKLSRIKPRQFDPEPILLTTTSFCFCLKYS